MQAWATALFYTVWGLGLATTAPALDSYFLWLHRAGYGINTTPFGEVRRRLAIPDPDSKVEAARRWAFRCLRAAQFAALPIPTSIVILAVFTRS